MVELPYSNPWPAAVFPARSVGTMSTSVPRPAPATAAPGRVRTYDRPVTHADLLVVLGGFVASSALGGVLITALLLAGLEPLAVVTGGIPTTVALWFLALWYSLHARGWTWTDLGLGERLGLRRWWWQVALAYLGVVLLASLVVSQLSAPGEQPNVMAGGVQFGPVAIAAIWVAVALVGPLVEEVVFRRILLGWLEARVGIVLAVLVQAALFAVLHVVPAAMVLTFLLGLATAALARRHRTLWPALALHALNNTLAVSVLLTTLR